jgi:hypothetical protein
MRDLMLMIVLCGALPVWAAPVAIVSEEAHTFGTVVRGTVVERTFTIHNGGDQALRIGKVMLTPPLVPTRLPGLVPPGADGVVALRLDTRDLDGPFEGIVALASDDPAHAQIELAWTGTIVPPIEVTPRRAFFVATQRGVAKEATLDLVSHEPDAVDIRAVVHDSTRFTTRVEAIDPGRRYRLHLRLAGEGPAGKRTEPITVSTSSARSPSVQILANTHVYERVHTFPDAVDMGALTQAELRSPALGARRAQTLMVYQAGGTDLRVDAEVDVPGLVLHGERGPAGDRVQITVGVRPDALPVGPIAGTIQLRTNDPEFPRLSIPVVGTVLDG